MHVRDASKAVGVVVHLLDGRAQAAELDEKNRECSSACGICTRPSRRSRSLLSPRRWRTPPKLDWNGGAPAAAGLPDGRRVVDVSLEEIVPYIDWTFFFSAWELKGRFPAILDDPKQGETARELFEHAQELLDRIESGGLLQRARRPTASGRRTVGGDDIVLYGDDGREHEKLRFRILRPETAAPPARTADRKLCLVRLRRTTVDSGVPRTGSAASR